MGEHDRRPGRRGLSLATAAAAAAASLVAGMGAASLAGVGLAGPAPAGLESIFAAAPAPAQPRLVPGTPCTVTARACVDIERGKAWLIEGGRVVRGPVQTRTGSPEHPTPHGLFRVEWKAQEYTSREWGVPMPYSVFFAPGGIAFHEGTMDSPSAGCVKLRHKDAVAWYDELQVGDEVQVT